MKPRPAKTTLIVVTILVLAGLTSCATTSSVAAPPKIPRLVQEHPMTGKSAAPPMPDANSRITSRTSPEHQGTDFSSHKLPIQVYAVKEGVVVSNTTKGSLSAAATITVDNTDGSVSRYLHIGSPVAPGDPLSIGQPLGIVLLPGQVGYGATNTGPHLHYEQYRTATLFSSRKFMSTDEVISQWSE